MDDATERQRTAAAPDLSAWIGANAGSGKTKVLIDRVARLLLAGAAPNRILCLTYTKAAAAEMQNRLFKRLGGWAMADDGLLAAELVALGEPAPDPGVLAQARRLFARALETPGGLKIQTLHAFCATILRRFPLEAGVPPDFAEADDRNLDRLRQSVLDGLATGAGAAVLDDLLAVMGDGKLRSMLAELDRIAPETLDGLPAPGTLFGLDPDFGTNDLLAEVWTGDEQGLQELIPILAASGPADQGLARALAALTAPSVAALPVLEKALLHGASAEKAGPFSSKAGKIPTKPIRNRTDFALLDSLDSLADRVAAARPLRLAWAAAQATGAVWAFARAWKPAMERAKAAHGWLTFDDLISRTRRLLADPGVAQWVLYKLDGGIDHILVDEAQDTSPDQWQIVARLVAELATGRGPRARTLFVVGDRKQSIFSFQGADLAGFAAARSGIAATLADQGLRLDSTELQHSFRSSPAILRLVDAAFDPEPGGLGTSPEHLAYALSAPGRVDLWPALARVEPDETGEWHEPMDRPATTHHDLVLARAIAAELRRLIDAGTPIPTRGGIEALHEGHILILVRRRQGVLFDALLQACKAQGLAMAGADRLVLADEPAVIDVLALLRAVALPEDDLSLATALRSALFGWSEDRLYRLAQGRARLPLAARLRADGGAAARVLNDLRDAADFLRPYELLERLLTRHNGRRHLVARYGAEAEEPLEALAELALSYEAQEIPTLDGFLTWLDASDAEVKRQVEGAGRRLRIMTVHGAKGLEAPLVILPDTADRRDSQFPALTRVAGRPVPRARADAATPEQAESAAAESRARADERDRLLYVALTRAQSWLVVAGAGSTDAPDGWYGRVAAAMERAGAEALETPTGPGWRHVHGAWPAGAAAPVAPPAQAPPPPPVSAPMPPPRGRVVLSPSDLGGGKALPGEAGAEQAVALARGSLVHALLEHLPAAPPHLHYGLALRLSAPFEPVLGAAGVAEARSEAARVLAEPALMPLFATDALVEVGLAGEWQGRVLRGAADRLLIGPGRVLALDIKTNRTLPDRPEDIPEGILRQLGAYAHLLAALHPRATVETAILWTAAARLMPVPAALSAAALARAALDPAVGAA